MAETKGGALVCIEGIDGSGKTTQASCLVAGLTRKGYDAVYTTEPSNGVFGKIIRKHILQGKSRAPPILEAILFAVDRVDHIENVVKPFLKMGRIVICDRCLYSSIAYQGALGLSLDWIREINSQAIMPNLAIYIDVPPEVVLDRINRERSVMETLQNQKRVRDIYLRMVREKELVMVDGKAPKDEVAERIEEVVLGFLKRG